MLPSKSADQRRALNERRTANRGIIRSAAPIDPINNPERRDTSIHCQARAEILDSRHESMEYRSGAMGSNSGATPEMARAQFQENLLRVVWLNVPVRAKRRNQPPQSYLRLH